MSISLPLKRSVIAVSAAMTLMAIASPSQAVVVAPSAIVGSFDPPFGISIPNLGFKGTFALNVFGCDPGAGGGYVFAGGNCSLSVNSLTLNFYNSSANPTGSPTVGGGYLQSYTLGSTGSNYPTAFQAGYILGAFYDANDQFAGFDTLDSNQFAVNVFDGGSSNPRPPISYNGNMELYFVSGHRPQLAGTAADSALDEDPAYLVDCNTRLAGTTGSCSRNTYVSSTGATVTFAGNAPGGVVPEPETVPLALIGLGALVASRWRRRSHGAASAAG